MCIVAADVEDGGIVITKPTLLSWLSALFYVTRALPQLKRETVFVSVKRKHFAYQTVGVATQVDSKSLQRGRSVETEHMAAVRTVGAETSSVSERC